MSIQSRIPWLLVPLSLALGGCNNDVTCVFTTGCKGGSGAISENEAQLPVDGQWIVDGPPSIEGFFPTGLTNSGTTPVVLVFSESLIPETVQGAIEIVPILGGSLPGRPLNGVGQALVSDGRVLVLLPGTALDAGDYIVRLAPQATITDLTGQGLGKAAGSQLGNFTVATQPPVDPRLVMTFPKNGASAQSETTEIMAVFDRPLQASSVDAISFDVKVDGSDPENDPQAAALSVQVGSSSVTDERVFLYRSVDSSGVADPLGVDVEVELALSPASHPIKDTDDKLLAPSTITFRTLTFAVPLAASLVSNPHDAIGLANLTDGDPEELNIAVDLDAGQPNDALDLFLFGKQKSTAQNPPLIALQRFVRLSGTAPITSATFLREDVALQFSSAPSDVRFQDGSVGFAFRLQRSGVPTPVRVLDLDPDPDVILDPVLDTTAPTLKSLVGSTGTDSFRSDQRGIVLAGTASERLSSVEVSTPLGNNGTRPPVVGSTDKGLFLAAPVAAGILAAPTTYALVARDAAANAAPEADGTFTQLGAVGPGGFTPGDTLDVEVFDSRTLVALAGALVIVHSDQGNGTDFPFVVAGSTLADGHVSLATAGAPSVGAIVTVVAPEYDLFTLHGVPSTRLSLPLRRSSQPVAQASGAAHSSDAAAVALLPGLDLRFDDSCRDTAFPRGFAGQTPTTFGGELACLFGPQPIQDSRLGASSFYAGDFSQTEGSFSPAQLLQAFVLSVPLAPATATLAQSSTLEVPFLLIDATTPPAEVAQALPACAFRVDPGSGVDELDLDDDPATTGAPFVDVETLVPGLSGAIAVAQGLAFDQGSGLWNVRATQPGAITPGGSLGSKGIVDTDPFLRMELVDNAGNAAGTRPRLSSLVAGGPLPEFRALAVPTVNAPAELAHTGGQAFDLFLSHAIGDDRSEGGLYRVELTDPAGRGWTIWRLDSSGSSDVQLRVVDPADGGGIGLADGTLQASAAAFAWASFSATAFLWSDVEREFELFSRAAPRSFVKP